VPTPEEYIKLVDLMETERAQLHARMDDDFARYNLEKYRGQLDANGEPIMDNYEKFTSNNQCTTMNLALHFMSTSQQMIRIQQPRAQKQQRELNNYKEMFCLGVIRAANERRNLLGMPSINNSLSAMDLFRGRWAQRVLLVKRDVEEEPSPELTSLLESLGMDIKDLPPRTETYVDVTDWDPRNVYWEMGPNGIAWACEKGMKTTSQILSEWGVDLSAEESRTGPGNEWMVYDYLDDKNNWVYLEGGRELKKETPHGMGRTPVSAGLVGLIPTFHAMGQDYDVHYGESFYKASRGMFDQDNFMLSIMAELTKRSIKQPLIVKSRDGNLTLPGDHACSARRDSPSSSS